MIPVFVGSDIIKQTDSEDGSTQVIERRCKLNVEAPYLLKKIAGVDFVYFIQINSLDRRNRALKIEAYNESFATRVIINEVCNYFVSFVIREGKFLLVEVESWTHTQFPSFSTF